MTIKHPMLGQIRNYDFPVSIKKGATYVMELITGTVTTVIKDAITEQYLVFNVIPKDAVVELNGEPLIVTDGHAQKFVSFGNHEYRITSPDYHTTAGKVLVNDPNQKQVVDIELKPAFGHLVLGDSTGISGAQVYLDDALIGKIPVEVKRVKSGNHKLRIIKPLYKPYERMITINDNETLTFSPSLEANFADRKSVV